ncbi:VOC family protein [Priestia koreensis]|uniref:VOC family protein n=1 Tax=Priestia koreensis TaxID=284581 RepID=UPI0030173171
MKLSFDHLVHFSHHPKEAMTQLKEHGIHVVQGGQHEKWGTYNTLAYFGLPYIEWLGMKDSSLAQTVSDNELIKKFVRDYSKGSHFGTFAVRTDNMSELKERLQSYGYKTTGPVSGSRRTENGQLLEWSMLFVQETTTDLEMPFFIQWGQDDDERLQSLQPFLKHDEQNLQFDALYLVTSNMDQLSMKWSELFQIQAGPSDFSPSLKGHCQTLHLDGVKLILCEPTEGGVAAGFYETFGARPFLASFSNASHRHSFSLQGGCFSLHP